MFLEDTKNTNDRMERGMLVVHVAMFLSTRVAFNRNKSSTHASNCQECMESSFPETALCSWFMTARQNQSFEQRLPRVDYNHYEKRLFYHDVDLVVANPFQYASGSKISHLNHYKQQEANGSIRVCWCFLKCSCLCCCIHLLFVCILSV